MIGKKLKSEATIQKEIIKILKENNVRYMKITAGLNHDTVDISASYHGLALLIEVKKECDNPHELLSAMQERVLREWREGGAYTLCTCNANEVREILKKMHERLV